MLLRAARTVPACHPARLVGRKEARTTAGPPPCAPRRATPRVAGRRQMGRAVCTSCTSCTPGHGALSHASAVGVKVRRGPPSVQDDTAPALPASEPLIAPQKPHTRAKPPAVIVVGQPLVVDMEAGAINVPQRVVERLVLTAKGQVGMRARAPRVEMALNTPRAKMDA